MKAWKNAFGEGKPNLHFSVQFQVVSEAVGRRSMILVPMRCLTCDGYGIDRDKLEELRLMPQHYSCGVCNGTGRRKKKA